MNTWERQEFINCMKQVDDEKLKRTLRDFEKDFELTDIDRRIATELIKAELKERSKG